MSDKDTGLGSFLDDLQGQLVGAAIVRKGHGAVTVADGKDPELAYLKQFAPNAIQWVVGKQYLDNPSTYHHVRQYEVIRDFFQLRCPLSSCNDQSPEAINCWGKGREYLESENLLEWSQYHQEDICPRCKTTRSEFISDGLLSYYNKFHLVIGMRSGKTATAGEIGTYLEHVITVLAHTQPEGLGKYFGVLAKQQFEITYIASTDTQSADTVWAYYTGFRTQSPWIKRYVTWIKKQEALQASKIGMKAWQYKELDKSIENELIRVKYNSMNSNCFVGSTLVTMASGLKRRIDEIKVGDRVLDRYGHEQVVEAAWEDGTPIKVLELTVLGGTRLRCTPNHRFPAWLQPRLDGIHGRQDVMAGELRPGDMLFTASQSRLPIVSIEVVDNKEPVYNLTVSNDHSYLANGIGSFNSGGMAGRTRLAAFCDELARFDAGDSKRSAAEAYRVLDNSCATVRSSAVRRAKALMELRKTSDAPPGAPFLPWLGSMFSITSPISADDEAMRMLEAAPQQKHMFARKYATWEFNPDQPRELFDDKFISDPVGTRRDFGADPPKAAHPYIEDPITFARRTLDSRLIPTARFMQTEYRGRMGDEYVQITMVQNPPLEPNPPRYICFDQGQSFDQFAGACGHGEWRDTTDGRQYVTVFDWIFRLLPAVNPRRDVWFDSIVELMKQLRKFNTIGAVDFDRWQSVHLIQSIRDLGVPAQMSGTRYEDFVRFHGDAMLDRIRMIAPMRDDDVKEPPAKSAYGLAYYELERLENTGKKVLNPHKGERRGYNSDDVAQVVVHVHRMVQDSVVDISDSNGVKERLHREQVGGLGWAGRGSMFRSKRGW